MIKDFRDGNKRILTMTRGEDKTLDFIYVEPSGSIFNWEAHNIVCQGRLSQAGLYKDFSFSVSKVVIDGQAYGRILFPSSLIIDRIRENKIYWKVIATTITGGEVKVIQYGEIWLKEI